MLARQHEASIDGAKVRVMLTPRRLRPAAGAAVDERLAMPGDADAALVFTSILRMKLGAAFERDLDALLRRSDLPAPTRQALVVKLSQTLAEFVTKREWLAEDRARRITKEACEKATVVLAAESRQSEVRPLIRHLRASGQLTAGLVLRALLSGNVDLFEEALAKLADVATGNVLLSGGVGVAPSWGKVTGSHLGSLGGTTNRVSKFAATGLADSLISDDGTTITLGTASSNRIAFTGQVDGTMTFRFEIGRAHV